MVLKASSLIKLKKRAKGKPVRGLLVGGITALLGVALLSETAAAVRRV
ncbi:hypothetical protein LCGC14_0477400 [marine sediment metagenome]|uniref:Uncharacterized protein n=1 Tax=marine sediment metagenome TaxID=412755 RepID=A0A0F9SFL7_9ZZZZ